jgi:hypothetical protein
MGWRDGEWYLFLWCGGLYNIFWGFRCEGFTWWVLKNPLVRRVVGGFVDRRGDDLVAEARASSADVLQEGCIIEGRSELVGRLV